jgi:hypothetical protein
MEKSRSLPTFTPMYSPGNMQSYFIHVLTECFIPSRTISLGPTLHTSWKLCETLQHLPTLQGTKKEVWTRTYPRQTTNH